MNQKGQSGLGILSALMNMPKLVFGIWIFAIIFTAFISALDFSTIQNGTIVQFVLYLFPVAMAITGLLILVNDMRNDRS